MSKKERQYVKRQPCGQEWVATYGSRKRPHFLNRWGSGSYTLDAVRHMVIKTGMVNSRDQWFEDVVQDVAIAVWERGARVEHAVTDSLRRYGPLNRRGGEKLNAISIETPIKGQFGPTISDALGGTDPDMDRIVGDEPTLQKIRRVLNEREQFVVIGVLNGVANLEIGRQLGISESRVSQVFMRAKEKLSEGRQIRTGQWDREKVIRSFRAWYAKTGRAPNTMDYRSHNLGVLPSPAPVVRLFGSWQSALDAADIPKKDGTS